MRPSKNIWRPCCGPLASREQKRCSAGHAPNRTSIWLCGVRCRRTAGTAMPGRNLPSFQLSDEPIVGARHIRRQRFPKMLDSTGREEIRTIQNKVIASLQYPPAHYPALHTSETVRAWYLEKFRRIDHPYGDLDDIWLRYGSEEHLATWAQFIIRKLPDCFEQAETWASKG